MEKRNVEYNQKNTRRTYGIHLTSTDIFHEYIFPEIKDLLYNYIWIDFYAGEGNLILPILEYIPETERNEFFQKHIFLFDIQPQMVQNSLDNATKYNISLKVAQKNILLRNSLEIFPKFLESRELPIFHITNPPYLYLGYIRKHKTTKQYYEYFEHQNNGYQDLYQIAMINDLRNGLENLIYILPTNFLFGASVSNKFRIDFLKYYKILKMIIFETQIFEFTGTNICIGFFKRKNQAKDEELRFMGTKIKKHSDILNKEYILKPEFKYRAGSEIEEFLNAYHSECPLKVDYYLLKTEVLNNKGDNLIPIIDANNYKNNNYKRDFIKINEYLKQKVELNKLYVRTVDTGSRNGRVGLSLIEKDFAVKGIYVSGNTYRTHPIQLFLEPTLKEEDQILLKNYFNFIIEYFRKELDSEFLTTYKYSNAEYTRKYLGLTQVRKLIETFPILNMDNLVKSKIKEGIEKKDINLILNILKRKHN